MDSIILPGQYVLSIPTAVGTYYLGPLQDDPYTIGILPEDVSPPQAFTLINNGGVDEYKILTKGLCVDKMRDGSLCLKADDGHCENVSSGNETYMIKRGNCSCWASPLFPIHQQAGFPILDGSQCCGMPGKPPCEMGDEKTTTSGGNRACTVCPPSCIGIKFVPV